MTFLLFLDESGDHGLTHIDPEFSVFVLSGVLFTENSYREFSAKLNELKSKFLGNSSEIIVSRKIRKCLNPFQFMLDLTQKESFYADLNKLVSHTAFVVVAVAVDKKRYKMVNGPLLDDVYEVALTQMVERTILALKNEKEVAELKIQIEKRGKREDSGLAAHYQKLLGRGTAKITKRQMEGIKIDLAFRDKKDNINGLQLADLVAYPIARKAIAPDSENPAFDVFAQKLVGKSKKTNTVRVFP